MHKVVIKLIAATTYALMGLKASWQTEQAFRLEVVALVVALPLVWWMPVSISEQVLLLGAILLVMVVELMNTAVEAVVDLVTKDHHALAGKAKDAASAAVLVSVVLALLVWGVVTMPLLLR
ncbi:MAG: diacylglycerol kinase [Hyphomicrobiales bacterium]|nr:diacylglycerol kinase [Rickettsiales bacterium]MCP5361050.1 diacylglycerol kinase [Hyphomicrobiales bacterium]